MKTKQLKNMLRIVFILASVSSLYFVPWIIVKAWVMPLPSSVQEQVNDSINYGFDGVIVYIDETGKSPAFYSAGLKNKENNIAADPHSLFKIASINKLYIAVAITKLVHSERLSLDKTLADYFPELVGRIVNADKISLRSMVQHRSGIPNYTDNPNFWTNRPKSTEEALSYALDLPANFSPEQDYGYSNTNYLLLRDLIERVVGYSHFQFIKETILAPLGLSNTFGSLSEVNIDDVMSGYYVGSNKDFKTDNAGMLATAEDVGIFLRALNDGSLFDEGEQDIYTSIYVYEHTGLIVGYQSIASYHKEIDTVLIQFMNTTNFDGYNFNLLQVFHNRIVKILKNEKSD